MRAGPAQTPVRRSYPSRRARQCADERVAFDAGSISLLTYTAWLWTS